MYCIYKITNKINGNRYIGQHKYEDESNPMGKYKGSGLLLHKAYKKYGIENFETEILYKRIRDKETVDAMEIWAIEKYKPEYNIAKGGSGGDIYHQLDDEGKKRMTGSGPNNPFYGKHHSEETKRKHSLWVKEYQSGENNPFYGKHHSEESKRKISESNKGKKRTEEYKIKLSDNWKGEKNPNYGKHLSEETKRKISDAKKGRHWYTNGVDSVLTFECPIGYKPGRVL